MALVPYVPWTLALCKEKMQFEGVGEGTYCAFFTPLQPGLATKIATFAKELQLSESYKYPLGTVGIAEENGVYLVMNWPGTTLGNIHKELPKKLESIGIYDKAPKNPKDALGILGWIRPLFKYLHMRLEHADALVYKKGQESFAVSSARINEEEKLEVMKEWNEDNSSELCQGIDDFVPFAKAFEDMFGTSYETDEKLRANCVEVFGKSSPELRTPWYKNPENADTSEASQPIQMMRQIPPRIRLKLIGRMQSKTTDAEGNIMEGICLECGDKTQQDFLYCSSRCFAFNNRIVACKCGSKNLNTSRMTFPMDHPVHTMRGKTSETVTCGDCKESLMTKCADMARGIFSRGIKRSAPEDHVPEWTKRAKA